MRRKNKQLLNSTLKPRTVGGLQVQPLFVGFRAGEGKKPWPVHAIHRADVCLLVNVATGYVHARGVALCSPKDKYSYVVGRLKALARAERMVAKLGWTEPIVSHTSTQDELRELGLTHLRRGTMISGANSLYLAERGPTLSPLEEKAVNAWYKQVFGAVQPIVLRHDPATGQTHLVKDDPVARGLQDEEPPLCVSTPCLACAKE